MAKKQDKEPRLPKVSKTEIIAMETERDHIHQSSAQVTSALVVVVCEQTELEKEVRRLMMQIADAKQRQKFLDAKRAGLNMILFKR